MFKILAALIRHPKARAIVWAHLTHPSRWTLGECAAVAGPAVVGLSLLLFWPAPQTHESLADFRVEMRTTLGELQGILKRYSPPPPIGAGGGITIGSPTGGDRGAGTTRPSAMCLQTDAAGDLVDAGASCGSGGTISGMTAGQIPFYSSIFCSGMRC